MPHQLVWCHRTLLGLKSKYTTIAAKCRLRRTRHFIGHTLTSVQFENAKARYR